MINKDKQLPTTQAILLHGRAGRTTFGELWIFHVLNFQGTGGENWEMYDLEILFLVGWKIARKLQIFKKTRAHKNA